MENTFYLKSPQQKRYLLLLALKALLLNLALGLLFFVAGMPLLIGLTIWATLQILAPFFDVPQMVKNGNLIYFSPLFLVEKESKGAMVLHGGTLFDYHFTINKAWSSKRKTNYVIQQYLLGLLHLVENKPDDLILTGTSYVLNTKTAERLGFKKIPSLALQRLILMLNAINLTVSASKIKGRLVVPPISRTNSYSATVKDIKANADFIRALIKRLEY
nr:hypothetical protein [uncultured Glaciecola sp.]